MVETAIAAGCVVLRDAKTEPEVLMIWAKQYTDPTLPKGHIEPGESAIACARRETEEETGYVVEVTSDSAITTERILDDHPPVVRKVIYWFPARVVAGSPEMRTEKSLITGVGWVSVSEAISRMKRADEIEALKQISAAWISAAASRDPEP